MHSAIIVSLLIRLQLHVQSFVCSGRDNYILEATYRFNNYNHSSVLFPRDSITPRFCFLQQLIYVLDTDKLTNQATGRQVGGQKDRVTNS